MIAPTAKNLKAIADHKYELTNAMKKIFQDKCQHLLKMDVIITQCHFLTGKNVLFLKLKIGQKILAINVM